MRKFFEMPCVDYFKISPIIVQKLIFGLQFILLSIVNVLEEILIDH
jgi:hypothetical protein